MTTVWVIETGDYECRFVWGVATSPEAAEKMIRSAFRAPYVVRWEDLQKRGDEYVLVGHFDRVLHYSTGHTSTWDITPQVLDSPTMDKDWS